MPFRAAISAENEPQISSMDLGIDGFLCNCHYLHGFDIGLPMQTPSGYVEQINQGEMHPIERRKHCRPYSGG